MPYCQFPSDFLWGTATAAYQIEGAASIDGRGPSVWDTLCRRPGAILFDHNGDVAADSYHRYKEDVALLKELGIKAYRFSVSWPRIFPDGVGSANLKGLDYYQRLIDELLQAGIQPWMTLFHWDLPQAMEDRFGGWESKECAHAFADYAAFMTKQVGDRLRGIFTINEFCCFLDKGYGTDASLMAPGKRVSNKILCQARHHALLGHGLAVQAIRAQRAKGLPIGLAENTPACVPIFETAQDIDAARKCFRETSIFLTPIMEKAYHPAYLEREGLDSPQFTDAEMQIIGTPLDFVGLNLYAPTYVRHAPEKPAGWEVIPCGPEYPKMDMPWLAIGPSILYWTPRFVSELWKPPAIFITENGCANPDRLNEKNEIWDLGRIMYLQQHLIAAHRAVAEGYPLKGYFLWSLLDNFEWLWGMTKRFGICYTNYTTLERTPKQSARFYADVIRRNAVGV